MGLPFFIAVQIMTATGMTSGSGIRHWLLATYCQPDHRYRVGQITCCWSSLQLP